MVYNKEIIESQRTMHKMTNKPLEKQVNCQKYKARKRQILKERGKPTGDIVTNLQYTTIQLLKNHKNLRLNTESLGTESAHEKEEYSKDL